MQKCEDRFQETLGISELKGRGGGSEVGLKARSNSDEGDNLRDGEEDPLHRFRECTILTLMEFMALTRAQAIELLMEHDGNLELCLESILT
mmetsp:Transcript_3571/g.8923  ORF Transcript_3571/g.8923 Transcript_3571/m.8923 type:complete len:91 (+) Transcript_3571:64-336(+)